jgi:hypothetical protein
MKRIIEKISKIIKAFNPFLISEEEKILIEIRRKKKEKREKLYLKFNEQVERSKRRSVFTQKEINIFKRLENGVSFSEKLNCFIELMEVDKSCFKEGLKEELTLDWLNLYTMFTYEKINELKADSCNIEEYLNIFNTKVDKKDKKNEDKEDKKISITFERTIYEFNEMIKTTIKIKEGMKEEIEREEKEEKEGKKMEKGFMKTKERIEMIKKGIEKSIKEFKDLSRRRSSIIINSFLNRLEKEQNIKTN